MEQARAADAARRMGNMSPLLGIPITVKNLFDTFDMSTNNGSLTFEGFRPARDAFQVAQLRKAGAVIIGKAALEEYATSGNYSNDAWGQVWNVFQPSKSALASSGGSASAVAASMAAAALGSQTGDSLYAPASGASLVTLRGTDGLQSGSGIMPLVWLTDFGGAMTRTVSDLADLLNVLARTDPEDPGTALTDSKVPADWRVWLKPDALKGARIGYIPAVWIDPLGTTNTIEASKAALQFFIDAGATIVEMGSTVGGTDTPPVPPDSTTGNLTQEGWMQYIDSHPELAQQGFQIRNFVDVNCSQKKIAYVRQDPSACNATPAPRMTAAEISAKRAQRMLRQASAKAWMDAAGVDAVVYPGLLSDISLNDGGGGRASLVGATPRVARMASPRWCSPPASTIAARRSTCNCWVARGTIRSWSATPTPSSSWPTPRGGVRFCRARCPRSSSGRCKHSRCRRVRAERGRLALPGQLSRRLVKALPSVGQRVVAKSGARVCLTLSFFLRRARQLWHPRQLDDRVRSASNPMTEALRQRGLGLAACRSAPARDCRKQPLGGRRGEGWAAFRSKGGELEVRGWIGLAMPQGACAAGGELGQCAAAERFTSATTWPQAITT